MWQPIACADAARAIVPRHGPILRGRATPLEADRAAFKWALIAPVAAGSTRDDAQLRLGTRTAKPRCDAGNKDRGARRRRVGRRVLDAARRGRREGRRGRRGTPRGGTRATPPPRGRRVGRRGTPRGRRDGTPRRNATGRRRDAGRSRVGGRRVGRTAPSWNKC